MSYEIEDSPTNPGENKTYSRTRDKRRGNHRVTKTRPFVSWDGEGAGTGVDQPQSYCLLGNSAGGMLINESSYLSTDACFQFLISESIRLKDSIHVSFGFGYDINHFLRDVPYEILRRIHRAGYARWGEKYRLEWRPKKWFQLTDYDVDASIRIYDTISFWQTSLVKALENDPKLRDHSDLARIREGKQARGTFQFDELHDKVIPYFQTEMKLHAQLMENLRDTLAEARVPLFNGETDLVPRAWYGPSAVVSTLYSKANLHEAMNRPDSDLARPRREKHGKLQTPSNKYKYTLPDAVNDAAMHAFAGGRFEQFQMGIHEGPVYSYDVTSAYPAVMQLLPDLSNGIWRHYTGKQLKRLRKRGKRLTELFPSNFGFFRIDYDWNRTNKQFPFMTQSVHPFFCRSEQGTISYPYHTVGWHAFGSSGMAWAEVKSCDFIEGWVYETDELILPFAGDRLDFPAMFEIRKEYGEQDREDLKYAIKIAMNAGYGKLAQKAGVELGDNLPAFHQIEWAAHITDWARFFMYMAARSAWSHGALVSIETDAIYATKPVPFCEEKLSDELGDFKRTDYTGIAYVQSGIYFLRDDKGVWHFHNRGLDPASVSIDDLYKHMDDRVFDSQIEFYAPLKGYVHLFNGLGKAGINVVNDPENFYTKWLTWEDQERLIAAGDYRLKRGHFRDSCKQCADGIPPNQCLHWLSVPFNRGGLSYPKKYAWIDNVDATENPELRAFLAEDLWQ